MVVSETVEAGGEPAGRIHVARRYVRRREAIGLLLWVAAVGVVYGTLVLPFHIHLLLVFLWLLGSGLMFVALTRQNLRDTESVFEESLQRISEAHEDLVTQMAVYSEAKDALTGEHLVRVRAIARLLALELGHSDPEADALGKAAVAHDIGKIAMPEAVLGKPGRLTPEEFELIKQHTEIGFRVLGTSPLFELERQCARHHHEWWDGNGYPDGLAADAIPLVARIASVADVYDALITRRPYKEPWPEEQAVQYIKERPGTQFDPDVVLAFARLDGAAKLPRTASETPIAVAVSTALPDDRVISSAGFTSERVLNSLPLPPAKPGR